MQRLRRDQATSRHACVVVACEGKDRGFIGDMPCGSAVRRTWYAVLHARAQQRDGCNVHVRGVQHDAWGRPPDVQLDGHRARHLLRTMPMY